MSAAAIKEVAHQAYLAALRNGQRPPRAQTIPNKKRKASREACRKWRDK